MELLKSKPLRNKVFVEVDDPHEEDRPGKMFVRDPQPPSCLVGVVRCVGEEVRDLRVGDRVYLQPDLQQYLKIKVLVISEDDILAKEVVDN